MKNNKKKIILGSIIGIMIGLLISTTYAIFSYSQTGANQQLITGDIYMHYKESNTLTIENALPSSTYDETKYFEFTVDGKNTNTKYDIYYDINIGRGDAVANKNTRLADKFIKFTLLEKIGDGEFTPVVENASYPDLESGMRIWKNTILKNTNTEVVNTYRLYAWIGNEVVIGNESVADYDMTTWNNDVFASIKVTVTGDFVDKELYDTLNGKIHTEFDNNVTYIKSYNNEIIANNPTFTTQDTVGVNNNKQDVLYYTGADALEHGNVLFAGYCWQIVRTTDTGAVKLIYNGVAVDNKCETSRSEITFKGVNASQSYVDEIETNMSSTTVYGRSYDYNLETGIFTLTDTNNLPTSWNDSTYKQLIGTYTCLSNQTTCNEIYYVGYYYNSSAAIVAKYTIGNISSFTGIGTSYYNVFYHSPALVGYMYNDIYIWNNQNKTGTYANDVSWNATTGKYVLIGTSNIIDNYHHYICDDVDCMKVRYYYFINGSQYHYYFLLENGETVESALKKMFNYKQSPTELNANVNVYSSAIKGYLDNWYKKNIFETQSESYIDKNVVYCNERSIKDLVSFNKNGGDIYSPGTFFYTLKFKLIQASTSHDLTCMNTTDRMSTANIDAKLKYSASLITESERKLMGSEYASTGKDYWGITPRFISGGTVLMYYVTSSGGSTHKQTNLALETRPVITLRSDSMVTEGDGGYSTPYVVGPLVTRDNTNYNY